VTDRGRGEDDSAKTNFLHPRFRIDACRWHVDAEAAPYKKRALEHFRDRYSVLLEFLRSEGLLSDPSFGSTVDDWMSFELHSGDLTAQGRELVRLCHGKWDCAFGQAKTQRHLVQWKRRLRELRSRAGVS
jgi:hypothetical protein